MPGQWNLWSPPFLQYWLTDDSVVGFRTQWQAQQFLVQLQERLARFGLSFNASKTRLIESGCFAARNRRKRGLGKPVRFDFLGFTHCCSTNRSGGFQILRLTIQKRMRATLLAIRDVLKRRRHESVQVVGQWLTRVVQWVLQLPRSTGKPDTSWWFSSGGVLSLAASPQTSQPAPSASMVSLRVAHRSLHTEPKERTPVS